MNTMTDKLLEQVDNIKEKITDQEYIDLMETLSKIHKEEFIEVSLLVVFTEKIFSKQILIDTVIEKKIVKFSGDIKLGDKVWINDNIMIKKPLDCKPHTVSIDYDLSHKDDDDTDNDCCPQFLRLTYNKYIYLGHKKAN